MTGSTTSSSAAAPARDASGTAVVGLLVLFEVMSGFTQLGITPLLPDLADAYGLSDSAANWVGSVQLLAATVCVPLFGRLGDLYGHRRMLRIALVCVAAGSLRCAAACRWPTPAVPSPAWSEPSPWAGCSAPPRWARRSVPWAESGPRCWYPRCSRRCACRCPSWRCPNRTHGGGGMDWPGFTLLTLGATALLLGVSALEHDEGVGPRVLIGAALGVLLLAWWVRTELRSREPLVDVPALTGRQAGPFYAAACCFGVVYFASQAPDGPCRSRRR
ncbi:MFS transporter [Streptomyces sp. NPDC002577]